MPLCCCCEKEPVFGKSIEEMLDKGKNNKNVVPTEIQEFVNFLSERNALQHKEMFMNSSELKKKNKLIKKINKAGRIDLKKIHDIPLVVSVFIEFLRRMPGRVISKDQLANFKNINSDNKEKDINKVQNGLKSLSQPRFETLKYLMTFFTGKISNTDSKVNIEISEILSISSIIASALIETPNDYTLPSKIYKNGNVINYVTNENNIMEIIKQRENIIRILITNYNTLFDNDKQEIYSISPRYSDSEISNYYSRTRSRSITYPIYDSPPALPKVHMRISSKQYKNRSRSYSESSSSYSSSSSPMTYHKEYEITPTNNKYCHSIDSDKSNDIDVKNLNYKIIGDKIHLTFTITTPESPSQDYQLEIPHSGTGLASIRNLSSVDNDSAVHLYRVTSFTEKSSNSSDSDSTINNPKNSKNSKNLGFKLDLPVFQRKSKNPKIYSYPSKSSNSSGSSKSNSNSNSFININYPQDNNQNLNIQSIVVQPDESVVVELQLYLKATRRYLYDLQSFPTGQIKELFKFSKQCYKLIKDVLTETPYINLEPIMNSPLFGPNKCYTLYEGLNNLTLGQKTLKEYDLFKKDNNIKDFIFQKTKSQCQMEKEFLYQKLIYLKENIKTENDRHILHELNKIYNSIRENLKEN